MDQPTPQYRWCWTGRPAAAQPSTPEWAVFKALISAPGGFAERLKARGFKKRAMNWWWRDDDDRVVEISLHAMVQVDWTVRFRETALAEGRGRHGFVFFERQDVWLKDIRRHWAGIMGDEAAPPPVPQKRRGRAYLRSDLRWGSILAAEEQFEQQQPVVPRLLPSCPTWLETQWRRHFGPRSRPGDAARFLADLSPHFPRPRPDWFMGTSNASYVVNWMSGWQTGDDMYSRSRAALSWRCTVDEASDILVWGWETYGAPWLERVERDGAAELADRFWSTDPVGFYRSARLVTDRRAWEAHRARAYPLHFTISNQNSREDSDPRLFDLWMCGVFDYLGQRERRDLLLQAILEKPPATEAMLHEDIYRRYRAGARVNGPEPLTRQQFRGGCEDFVESQLEEQERALAGASRFAWAVSRREGGLPG